MPTMESLGSSRVPHLNNMKFTSLSFVLLVFLDEIESLYDPQAYVIHMYHHQSLTLPQEGHVQQDGRFYLRAKNEHNNLYKSFYDASSSERRDKRQEPEHQQEVQSSSDYENNDYQYKESIETSEEEDKETFEYDYDKYKKEYYTEDHVEDNTTDITIYDNFEETDRLKQEIKNESRILKQSASERNAPTENYCSVILLFRLRVMYCFWLGLTKDDQDLKARAGWVIAFWFALYSCTACYLWCSKGWCYCCCPCSFCQPRSVIQEAKVFLAQNPPGTASMAQGGKITYFPNEFEVQSYKDLEKNVYNF